MVVYFSIKVAPFLSSGWPEPLNLEPLNLPTLNLPTLNRYLFFFISAIRSFTIDITLLPLSRAIWWASSTILAACRARSASSGMGWSSFWYCQFKNRIAIFSSCCLINPMVNLRLEYRGQMTDVRCQMSDVRCQRTEDR